MISFLLNKVIIWRFFRRFLDQVFGLYSNRVLELRKLGINDKMTVLDVGCGTGQFSGITGNRYLGIDLSEKYITMAKRLYKNHNNKEFICEDLTKVEISEKGYDVALVIDFTHHIGQEELEILFKRLNKIVSQYIVFIDPVLQNKKNIWGRLLIYLDRGKYIRSEKETITLINDNFEILKVKKTRGIGIEGVFVLSKPRINTKY